MRLQRALAVIVAGLSLAPVAADASPVRYHITPLGYGGSLKEINNAGQYLFDSHRSGHIYDSYGPGAGNPRYLGTLGGYTRALGLNNLGEAVGESYTKAGELRAFVSRDGRAVDLGTLPGGNSSTAAAINDAGQIVGWSTTAGGYQLPFLYDQGRMVELKPEGEAGWPYGKAHAINQHGVAVGEWSRKPFVYRDGRMEILGDRFGPEFVGGEAYDINDLGQIVGRYADELNWYRSFLIDGDGEAIDLGSLGGEETSVFAINNRGQIVGTSRTGDMTMGAFIYQDGVMENLNDLTIHGETWRVELPYDINDLGQILAAGAGPEGTSMLLLTPEGVPLPAQPTPVPEPGTLAIGLVLAGAGVVAHRRRARMRRAAGGS